MFEKVKKAIKNRKEKKAKKQKLPKIHEEEFVLVRLNEVELLRVLRGEELRLSSGTKPDAIRVLYTKHPSATPQGLMQFWADVIAVAQQKRRTIETAPGTVNNMAGKSMDFAVEQKQYDNEDSQGVAVRSGPAVAAAMRDQSFVPLALKQIAGQLQSQHEAVEKVKALAETPEQADAAVKKLSVGEAIKQLENKHVEGKES